MREVFKKIPVTIPELKLDYNRKKRQILLTVMVFKWYINNIGATPSSIKNPILSKKSQEKDYNILKN